jgi:hypothetical protein
MTGGVTAKFRRLFTGYVHSGNVWFLEENTLLANVTNYLFISRDGGATWELIKHLHPSSGMRGILPSGLCYSDGTIYLGEYIFDESRSPRIFISEDLGQSWQTELVLDGIRHVHAVQVDPYTGDIWITTGDRDSEAMIGRIVDGQLDVIGTGSQLWRAVELVFTPEYILWGTDCPYKKNYILRVSRDDLEKKIKPEPVHTVAEPFYYSSSVKVGDQTIVLFSTGGGFGADSTAPDSVSQTVEQSPRVGILGGTSITEFSDWSSLAEYKVRKQLTNYFGLHNLAANSYVFLASSQQRGIFINPVNTVTNNGDVLNISAEILSKNDLQSAFEKL